MKGDNDDRIGMGHKKKAREHMRDPVIYGNGSGKGNKVSSKYGETIVDIKASNWKRGPCGRCKKQRKKCDRGEPCTRCKNSNSGQDCAYEDEQGRLIYFKVPRRDGNINMFSQGTQIRTKTDFMMTIVETMENGQYVYNGGADIEIPEDTTPEQEERIGAEFQATLEEYKNRQNASRQLFAETMYWHGQHDSSYNLSQSIHDPSMPEFQSSPTPPELIGSTSSPELSEESFSPFQHHDPSFIQEPQYISDPNYSPPQDFTSPPPMMISPYEYPSVEDDTPIPVNELALISIMEVLWSNAAGGVNIQTNIPTHPNGESVHTEMIYQLSNDANFFDRTYAPDEIAFGGPRGKLERALRVYLEANGENIARLERILPPGFDDVQAIMFEVLDLFDWQTTIITEFQELAKSIKEKPERNWRKIAVEWKSLFDEKVRDERMRKEYEKPDELLWAALNQVIDKNELAFKFEEEQLMHLCQVWYRLQPRSDIIDHITYLKSKYIIVGVSNLSFGALTSLSRRAGFIWDTAVSTALLSSYMPNLDVFQYITKKLALEPGKLAFVGTNLLHLEAATTANMTTIMIFGDGKTVRIPRRRPNVKLYLKSLNEFISLVKGNKINNLSSGVQETDDKIGTDLVNSIEKMSMVEASA